MSKMIGHIEVLADPPSVARHAAEWMTALALAAPGLFRVSLSGGSTPKALYDLLASDDFIGRFPWERVHWYWGDERFVPYDHPDSNFRMTREAMLAKAPIPPENVNPMPTDGDPDAAALRYERTCRRRTAPPCWTQPGRCTTSPCWGSAPTVIRRPCSRASRCWRSANAGWPPFRMGARKSASP